MATKPAAKPQLRPVPPAEEEAAPVKKKSRLVPMLALIVVLVAAGAAGWFFMHKNAPEGSKVTEATPAKPPVFVTLEPFTVNLQGGDHFLQLGIVLQVAGESTSEAIKLVLPQIRNRLLLLLSSKAPSDLESSDAKVKLAGEILAETRKPLGESAGEGVQEVLFSSMVIQ